MPEFSHEGLISKEGLTNLNFQCKAPPLPVRHTLVVVSRMISLCRSSTTIFTWPSLEARCKPFNPFCKEQRGGNGMVSQMMHSAGPIGAQAPSQPWGVHSTGGKEWRVSRGWKGHRAGPPSLPFTPQVTAEQRWKGRARTGPPLPDGNCAGSFHKTHGDLEIQVEARL